MESSEKKLVASQTFWVDRRKSLSRSDSVSLLLRLQYTYRKNFFSNNNCVMMDHATITIGDNVLIAPNVTITTVNHSLNPEQRRVFYTKESFHPGKKGNWETVSPVTIGNDVWIGTGSIILPGVTIGSGATIGAGSVVTQDIPPNVIAFGSPCKVVRKITPE